MLYQGDLSRADCSAASLPALTVEDIYAGQKLELADAIRRVIDAVCPLDFDIQSIARLMHNLAGTSSYFGESHIGECAAVLEPPLRAANDAASIKSLCGQMLDVLG